MDTLWGSKDIRGRVAEHKVEEHDWFKILVVVTTNFKLLTC